MMNESMKTVEVEGEATPATCRVISPATLEGGATFEAQVDGITFMVTVPEGGVGAGDDFEVPYPTKAASVEQPPEAPITTAVPIAGTAYEVAEASTNAVNAYDIPTGKWRFGLCDCFEACCCPCLMGWCCTPILMGQVMQRMKFNWLGCPNEASDQPPLCIVYTAITLVLLVLGSIIMSLTRGWGIIIWYIWGLYMIIVFTCARFEIRKKYKIEGTCGCCGDDNPVDDCCTVYWCSCCSAIQVARHLYDPTKTEYNAWTQTGADYDAPEIV